MSIRDLILAGLVVAAIAFALAIISLRLGPAKPKRRTAARDAGSGGDSGGWSGDSDWGGGDGGGGD